MQNEIEWLAREVCSFSFERKTTERLTWTEKNNQFSSYYSIDIIIWNGVRRAWYFHQCILLPLHCHAVNKKRKWKITIDRVLHALNRSACVRHSWRDATVQRTANSEQRNDQKTKTKIIEKNCMKNEMSRCLLQFTIPSRLNGIWMLLKIIMNLDHLFCSLNLFFQYEADIFGLSSFFAAIEQKILLWSRLHWKFLFENLKNRSVKRRLCNHRVDVEQLINIVSRCIQNV